MNEFLSLMLAPFAACVILTGMHAYLGLHIVKRGVIFVDLALAQLAALGATVAFLFDAPLHSTTSYLLSLGFSLAGGIIFSYSRYLPSRIPQEAVIGAVYAVAGAAAILVLSRAPEGSEELKALLVGHLLFVEWSEIRGIFFLYLAIGLLHYLLRKRFFQISFGDYTQGAETPLLWDLLFYASFALVVTSSVEIAGVLLVFSLLVIPAVSALALTSHLMKLISLSWGIGLVGSTLGICSSYYYDLPTGAAVTCTLGVVLVLVLISSSLCTKPEPIGRG